MGLPKTYFINSIIPDDGKYFVQFKDDEDNFFEFVKTKFIKKPIIGFPCNIVEGRAEPCEGYDAQIDLKYHLIKFKNCKDEDHLDIHSLTAGGNYCITIKDLRPLIVK